MPAIARAVARGLKNRTTSSFWSHKMRCEPARSLVTLLTDWDLTGDVSQTSLEHWSEDDIRQFHRRAKEVLEEGVATLRRELATVPRQSVVYPEERCGRSPSALSRCLLYADQIVLPIALPAVDAGANPEQMRRMVADWYVSIRDLVPFLRTALVMPVPVSLPCAATLGAYDDFTRRIRDREAVRSVIAAQIEIGLRSERVPLSDPAAQINEIEVEKTVVRFDGTSVLQTTASVPGGQTVHIPLLPIEGSFRVPSAEEVSHNPRLRDTIESAIRYRLTALARDWRLATGIYGAKLVTASEIAWKVIEEIEAEARAGSRHSTERTLMELDLPFLPGMNPMLLAEIRERNEGSLGAFRMGLDAFAEELSQAAESGADERQLRLIRNKHIDEPLRELDRRFREINVQRFAEIAGAGLLAGGACVMAFYAGQPPAVSLVSMAVAALGSGKLLDSIAKLMSERASLARSSMHMLWRIKGTASRADRVSK
jgi:hypothetical protein